MAVYNVIPARFTNLDIRDTLNANGGSVGDNSSDYFGVRANVNIFSLKKPVKFNKQFVTDADAWWKADNGNFGIILPPTGSLPAVGSPMSPWSWDFPGGSGSPLRIQIMQAIILKPHICFRCIRTPACIPIRNSDAPSC